MNKGQEREQQAQAKRRWWAGVTRDLILFTVGVLLIINEAVIRTEPPRESLLLLYAGMVGLPAVLRADQMRREHNEEDK